MRSTDIRKGEDGVYRWTAEMNLYTNPTVLIMVWKIFFFICLGIFVFDILISMGDTDFWWDGFLGQLKIMGIITAGMTVLCALGYLVYALMMGGKYIVLFEMDENGVSHTQTEAQAKKARKIGAATAAAGALAGRPSAAGAGLISASRASMRSEFEKVRSIKAYPRRGVIKVNMLLEKNQVYIRPEDYGFVLKYITDRCPNAKKNAAASKQ